MGVVGRRAPGVLARQRARALFTSSIGLLIILLYIPGGFVQIGYYVRDSMLRWVEKRMGPAPQAKTVTVPPTSLRRDTPLPLAPRNADGTVLATDHLTVRFGGLVAVDDVEFHAAPGEVIGLIGNNGAGKSTLLNAIGGYVPSRGSVMLLGRDVSSKSPHRHARLGLGRTFQARACTRSSPCATPCSSRSSAAAHIVLGLAGLAAVDPGRARQAQRGRRAHRLPRARPLRRSLHRRAVDRRAASWSWRRCSRGARVICLDEPTAGVAQREAEAFGPLILRVQQELDATLVVVEHDLRSSCRSAAGSTASRPAGSSPWVCPTRCATTRASSPVSRHRRARSSARTLDSGQLLALHLPPLASVMSVAGSQSPVPLPALELNVTSRAASSAAYLPLHSDAMSVATSSIGPSLSTVFCQFLMVRFGPTFSAMSRNMNSSPQKSVTAIDSWTFLPWLFVSAWSGPGTVVPVASS